MYPGTCSTLAAFLQKSAEREGSATVTSVLRASAHNTSTAGPSSAHKCEYTLGFAACAVRIDLCANPLRTCRVRDGLNLKRMLRSRRGASSPRLMVCESARLRLDLVPDHKKCNKVAYILYSS